MLYLIPFLHQTTTIVFWLFFGCLLYLIPFLHQTTTITYQRLWRLQLYLIPFLHQTTTSIDSLNETIKLYLIPFLHQTTTSKPKGSSVFGCILFHFYIKPQHTDGTQAKHTVVSYSISTSNHNVNYQLVNFGKVVSYSISTSNHNPAGLR